MKIKQAEFLQSAPRVEGCPQTGWPEFAFIGRSNVGKSSLINMLTGRRKLAMTSGTPGKTLLINHYAVDGRWYLVDLPGYGYAKRSKRQQAGLSALIDGYVARRRELTCLFVLIDSRLEPQPADLAFIRRMGQEQVPISLVFTKADKMKPMALRRSVEGYLHRLREEWETLPPHFVTSSETGLGREELLAYISEVIDSL